MATKKSTSPNVSFGLSTAEYDGITQELEHIANLADMAFDSIEGESASPSGRPTKKGDMG